MPTTDPVTAVGAPAVVPVSVPGAATGDEGRSAFAELLALELDRAVLAASERLTATGEAPPLVAPDAASGTPCSGEGETAGAVPAGVQATVAGGAASTAAAPQGIDWASLRIGTPGPVTRVGVLQSILGLGASPGAGSLGSLSAAGLPARPRGVVPPAEALDLVPIGQGGHRLNRLAATALSAAEGLAGKTIEVTDSYRSTAQQADLKARKPAYAARPGYSLHEVGLAIDVVEMHDPTVVRALEAAGWQRYDPDREPWHFSYGYRG